MGMWRVSIIWNDGLGSIVHFENWQGVNMMFQELHQNHILKLTIEWIENESI